MIENSNLELATIDYKELVEEISDALFSTDARGIVTYISPAIKKISGLKSDEFLNKHLSFVAQIHDSKDFSIDMILIEANGKDFRIKDTSGEQIWINISLKQKNNYYIGIIKNITDKKNIENALIEKNDLLQTISLNMFDKIVLADLQGNYTFCGNAERVLGFRDEDMIGKNALNFIHPDDLDRIQNAFVEFVTGSDGKTRQEYRNLCADGSYIWLETVGRIIKDIDGNPKEILFCSRDISERKLAEVALKESEEKYRLIVEHSSDLVWSLDLEGKFQYVSPSWKRETGYTPELLVGKGFYEIINEEDLPVCREFFNSALEVGEPKFCLEYRLCHTDGKWYNHEAAITPIHGKDGKVISIAGICRNITERKEWERKITAFNESLELEVKQRTNELNEALSKLAASNNELQELYNSIANEARKLYELNEKLAISEQELIKANRTKDKFFSILAHDINSPIQAILIATQVLANYRSRFTDEQLSEKMKNLSNTAMMLSSTVNTILNWARSQSNTIDFQPAEIDLKSCIESASMLLSSNAAGKKITVNYDENSNFNAFADENMANTIIRNLLSNAIKFTAEGGTIEIGIVDIENKLPDSTYNFFKADEYLTIYVKDNGVGMSNEKIDKLFKIDESVTTLGTAGEKGTGLGLILCKEFVDRHSGKIWVESQYGKGSTFFVSLPKV